jgi:S1-C subfamily serine protease
MGAVAEGSPAEAAGIQPGDVIREVNRTKIRSFADFEQTPRGVKEGDQVTRLLQRGGSPRSVAFTVQPS